MIKAILAISFLLFAMPTFANQFTDFPDGILSYRDTDCHSWEKCIIVDRIISHQGFYTSRDEGYAIPNSNVPGGYVYSPYYNVDETGSLNTTSLSLTDRLDLKGTILFQKSDYPLVCDQSGLLDLNFTGDFYHVNVQKFCSIQGITGERESGLIPSGHEIKLVISGGDSSLFNMSNVPPGYAPLKMPFSQGMNYSREILVVLLKDDGVWRVEEVTEY